MLVINSNSKETQYVNYNLDHRPYPDKHQILFWGKPSKHRSERVPGTSSGSATYTNDIASFGYVDTRGSVLINEYTPGFMREALVNGSYDPNNKSWVNTDFEYDISLSSSYYSQSGSGTGQTYWSWEYRIGAGEVPAGMIVGEDCFANLLFLIRSGSAGGFSDFGTTKAYFELIHSDNTLTTINEVTLTAPANHGVAGDGGQAMLHGQNKTNGVVSQEGDILAVRISVTQAHFTTTSSSGAYRGRCFGGTNCANIMSADGFRPFQCSIRKSE